VQSGEKQLIHARRVLLAAGALNSTRIMARSLRLEGKPIRLLETQYFFFPFLSYKKHAEAPRFTLAELFVEINNPKLGGRNTHFQVYGLNSIFRQALRAMVPGFLRQPWLLDEVEKRFFLFQGFLHSESSGSLELTLRAREDNKDRVQIRGISSPSSLGLAHQAKRLIARELRLYGIVPPLFLKMVPLGRSNHIGGSFRMGAKDDIFQADRQGRPAGLKRVHLLDASTFPSIPATTITFTIMANSDRIIGEIAAGNCA
jgi:GMC oxidoreductase